MQPDNPYVTLLDRARGLKDSRKGGGGGQDPSTPVLKNCLLCGEDKAHGYTAPCCGQFLCSDCIAEYNKHGYAHLFKLEGGVKCAYCSSLIADTSALLAAGVPATALGTGATGMAAITDDQAWMFTLVHNCGHEYMVLGWEECDVLSDNCDCGERNVNLIGGPRSGHSYQMRDLLKLLQGYHKRSSASTFARLRQDYPLAWAAFHLDQLINTLAAGGTPDLSYWNPETVEFLTLRAAEIKKLLGI